MKVFLCIGAEEANIDVYLKLSTGGNGWPWKIIHCQCVQIPQFIFVGVWEETYFSDTQTLEDLSRTSMRRIFIIITKAV